MNIYLKEMQDYLEQLCVLHANILHTIDSSGKRSFAKFQSDEQIDEIRQRGGENIVVVIDYYGQIIQEYDDQKMQQAMRIMFGCKALTGNDQATRVNNAVQLSFKIMMDFITRMRYDFDEDNCGALKFVDFDKLSWEAFEGPVLDSFYGFNLEIPFRTYLPALDEDVWNDLVA
jgi:hypothetical protein